MKNKTTNEMKAMKQAVESYDKKAKILVEHAMKLADNDFLGMSLLITKAAASVMAHQLMGEVKEGESIEENHYAKLRDATILYGMLVKEHSDLIKEQRQ